MIHCFCVSVMIHMVAQLKIIGYTLANIKITKQRMQKAKQILHTCIYESSKITEINSLMEDLMNQPFLIRYTAETLAICCIVYITPSVS